MIEAAFATWLCWAERVEQKEMPFWELHTQCPLPGPQAGNGYAQPATPRGGWISRPAAPASPPASPPPASPPPPSKGGCK